MFPSATLVWLALWSTALLAVGMLRNKLHHNPVVKLIFMPGFALDAVLRLVACLLSGTKVRQLNLLRRGPSIETDPSPIKHIGPAIFITTRLFLIFAGLYCFLASYPDLVESTLHLPIYDPEELSQGRFEREPLDQFFQQLQRLPAQLKVHRLHGWIFVYITVSLVIAASLSAKEYLAAIYTIVIFHLLGFGCSWLGVTFGFLSRGQLIGFFYSEGFWSCFSLLFLLTTASFVTLIPFRIVWSLLPNGGDADKETSGNVR